MSRRLLLVSLTGLLACGDEFDGDTVPFAELCGQRGPVRLLELPPGHQLAAFPAPFKVGERHYFRTTRTLDLPADIVVQQDGEVWSTGPCGESPRQHTTAAAWVSTQRDRYTAGGANPVTVFACGGPEHDQVVTLDPDGGPPTPFMPGVRCDDYWSDHGVVATPADVDQSPDHPVEFSPLVLHPYPATPHASPSPVTAPILLHPQIRLLPKDPAIGSSMLRKRAHELFAVDATDQLLRFDLRTGLTEVIASDVLTFQVSLDEGRWILWQHTAPPLGDDDPVESAVILHDRTTRISVALGETALAYSSGAAYDTRDGVLPLTLDGDRIVRVFHVPDLLSYDLPNRHVFEGVLDDHRVVISSWRYRNVSIYDGELGEQTPLVARRGEVLHFNPRRTLFAERTSYRDPLAGPLYYLPHDGTQGHLAARRLTRDARPLGDTRLLTPADLDSKDRGLLLLVDLTTAVEQLVDTRVPATSFAQDAGFGPDHVVYSVDDGARSGIYVARLPPGEAAE